MAELRADPLRAKERLAGHVHSVAVLPLDSPEPLNEGPIPRYIRCGSFLIDRDGASHLLEQDTHEDRIVTNAAWAAELLSVPLRNETFGHAQPAPVAADGDAEARGFERRLQWRRWVSAGILIALAVGTGAATWFDWQHRRTVYQQELILYEAEQRSADEAIERQLAAARRALQAGVPPQEIAERLEAADTASLHEYRQKPTYLENPFTVLGVCVAVMFAISGVATLRPR